MTVNELRFTPGQEPPVRGEHGRPSLRATAFNAVEINHWHEIR
jgi:hypothetical protein